jgi:hypothetical protein
MARSSILAIIDSDCLAADLPPRNLIAGTVPGKPQPRGIV